MSDSTEAGYDGSRGIPAIAPRFATVTGEDAQNWSVKYFKAAFHEVGDMLELQAIETRAARNEGVVIQSKKNFSFNEQYFIVICYWERNI